MWITWNGSFWNRRDRIRNPIGNMGLGRVTVVAASGKDWGAFTHGFALQAGINLYYVARNTG
ncbi:MAG: hypothetical protein Kow00105_10890 [Phycisphaeraceae bacterium]